MSRAHRTFLRSWWHRFSTRRNYLQRRRIAVFETLSARRVLAADLEIAVDQTVAYPLTVEPALPVNIAEAAINTSSITGGEASVPIETLTAMSYTQSKDDGADQAAPVLVGGAGDSVPRVEHTSELSGRAQTLGLGAPWGEIVGDVAIESLAGFGDVSANSYGGYGGYGGTCPSIMNFQGVQGPNGWTFSGSVQDDESVEGLTVNFGGLLSGQTASVAADGTFSITVVLEPDAQGIVTAVVTDLDGLTSETASDTVG